MTEDAGSVLGIADVAEAPLARMIGLLGRDVLPEGEGLVLRPCSMIHTCFMRFAIDVLFTDRQGSVLALVDTLRPFRLAWGGWSAVQAIELPAGTLRRSPVARGTRLRLEHVG
jgi:uncharacterized membrane protein (UPF0127 family)